jgi:hypothetical protein
MNKYLQVIAENVTSGISMIVPMKFNAAKTNTNKFTGFMRSLFFKKININVAFEIVDKMKSKTQ